ncbi:hypothetical protein HanHA89_Chr16g0674661 [Helianthus annuus]|nr:hypothetical protein HanHA89_Chr16g0674661 [Helianthus annuus]
MLGFQPQPQLQPDRGSASDVSERNLSGFSGSGDVSEGNSSGFSGYSFVEDPFSIPMDGFLKQNLHRLLVPPDEHDLVNDQIIPGAPAPFAVPGFEDVWFNPFAAVEPVVDEDEFLNPFAAVEPMVDEDEVVNNEDDDIYIEEVVWDEDPCDVVNNEVHDINVEGVA